MKMQMRSRKQQRIAAELGGIIDEMGQAMWNADKEYVAGGFDIRLTYNMAKVLWKFKQYCRDNHAE